MERHRSLSLGCRILIGGVNGRLSVPPMGDTSSLRTLRPTSAITQRPLRRDDRR
ncbi:hypothetical protein AKJ09_10416 [Labilithrix luteola]|uniref:Uncharacterized protein n=1 Tax=Labilithrix luteola TaxID=1391654 RepID=A0A0K1QDG2_9BACT|nr:hypothetical protein AKJ09_10416 [Labilithrix luteola]